MKRFETRCNIPALVLAMIEAGASFRQTDAGTWLVDGLTSLPVTLRDEFFACDDRALAKYLKERLTIEKTADRAA